MSQSPDITEKKPAPDPKKDEAKSALRKLSLKIAGVLYSIGDLTFATAEILKGKSARDAAAGAVTWFSGGVVAAIFGNEKPERKLRRMRRDLSHYLHDQGVEIPDQSVLSARAIEKESHAWDEAADFLYKHPSQMLNTAYGAGALMIGNSALKNKAEGKNWKGLALSSAAVEAGALSGLLIPEYKTPPTQKPEGVIAKAWDWMRQKPLRVSSIFYWINNIGLLMKGLEDKKTYTEGKASKSYIFSFITLGLYVIANGLLLITPKEEVNKKTPLDISPLEKALAELIAAQPAAMQEHVMQQVAGYLAARPEINHPADAIAQGIKEKMGGVVSVQADSSVLAPAEQQNVTAPLAWQDKVMAVPALAPNLAI